MKTSAGRRQIHLSVLATEALQHHHSRQVEEQVKLWSSWQTHDLVFCITFGVALRPSNFRRQSFARLVCAADVPYIRPCDMRHTAATLLLLAGVHPKVVSEMLGHASIAITLHTYSHVLPMIQQEAAAAMDRIFGA